MIEFITALIAFATFLLGIWGKGIYDKRKEKVNTDSYELENYSELYEKMRAEFVKLHEELLLNQKTTLQLRRQVSELTDKVEKLTVLINSRDKTINDLSLENQELKARLGEADL